MLFSILAETQKLYENGQVRKSKRNRFPENITTRKIRVRCFRLMCYKTVYSKTMCSIQSFKTKRLFLILFLLSMGMVFGTGCSVFGRKNLSGGEIIDSRPHGRLKPGEVDNMSGTKNFNPVKKNTRSGKKAKKSNEKPGKGRKANKKSDEKSTDQQRHWQTKKNMRKYRR